MQCTQNIFQSNRLVPNTDSSVFQYIAINMKNGLVPYLNMFDHKGLLLYFINFLGVSISPKVGIWFVEFVFMFFTVTLAFKLAKKFISSPYALVVVTVVFSLMSVYFEGGNLTEEYALPFQLLALNIFFEFFMNPKRFLAGEKQNSSKLKLDYKYFNFLVFICGICFSCVLFLRANMISIWVVFVIMTLIYCVVHRYYVDLLKFVISFLLGMSVICIPMVLYLLKHGALKSFVECYIMFNMNYSNTAGNFQKVDALIHFFNNSIVILSFVIIIIKIFIEAQKKKNWYFDFGYLMYMILTLILISMSGNTYNHYGMTMLPALIYPYSMLFKFINEEERRKAGINLIVTGYLIYVVVVPFMIPLVRNSLNEIYNKNLYPTTNEIIEYINKHTTQNDLISVFGNSDYIYNYTNRKSASRYSYQIPIIYSDSSIMDEYLLDLENNNPKIVVNYFDESDNSEYVLKMKKFLDDHNYKKVQEGIYQLVSE